MVQDDDTIKRDRKPAAGNDRTINPGSEEEVKQAKNYNQRLESLKTDLYPEWVEVSTRSFFPFLFLTLTHPSRGEWATITWRLGFSEGGPSFSESEEEVKWARLWAMAKSEECASPSLEGTTACGAWSKSASLASSSEQEESESTAGGGEQGAHRLDLCLERFSFFFFAGREWQVDSRCPVWC